MLAPGGTLPVYVPWTEEAGQSVATEQPAWQLLSDHPVEPDADVLDFAGTARRMAEIILGARAATPFTIGIQGGWGTGKSSLMHMIRREIEDRTARQRGRTRVAWFNAWTAEGSSALTALIRSVLQELDPSVLRRLLHRTRRSSWILAPILIVGSLLGLRRFADDLWARFNVDAAQRNEVSKELRGALADWAEQDRPLDERRMLVVFIDDLDRCSPDNIVQVLDAIRLYLDAPGLIFVIGYDHAVVVDALSRARGASAGVRSRTYLEKIIQVDHVIPLPDPTQTREMALACARHCGVADILGVPEINLIVDRTDRNLRRLKRFLNTFVLSRQLDATSVRLRPDEHIKMLLLRMYFPDLFRIILREPERDVLGQLVELGRYRAAVTAGQPPDEEQVTWLFQTSGVAPPKPDEDAATALNRLERHLPRMVINLSLDPDLFSLAWSLGTPDQRQNLLERARTQLRPTTAQPAARPAATAGAPTPVEPSAATTPSPQATGDAQTQPLVCPMCGHAANLGDQHFCPSCGAYLDRA
ncbi:KAP family P-loop NTPase fold protein [Micromonospora sp. BQ11]|uniref:KAP family P-loop NTPase fold protein n=1 Tax=Micromonospora sp. BQ11 TaxID=3452212 RepID=UPI003F8992F2